MTHSIFLNDLAKSTQDFMKLRQWTLETEENIEHQRSFQTLVLA